MIKINKIILTFIFITFLHSCGQMSDAGKVLRNEKIRTTDEFLVKKREPLSLPPDYDALPEPGSREISKEARDKNINEILKIPEQTSSKKSSSSVEQSIINEIRK
tara:strand:+ start:1591 stop:1905 length:315 start_codon:yes stop_codon:yes gene_type:complete